MSERSGPHLLTFESASRTWLTRALLIASGAIVVAIGVFFITIALVIGSVLALAIAVRWWWFTRRLREARGAAAPLEGEYTILERAEPEKLRR